MLPQRHASLLDRLTELCATAEASVLLAAPFVKAEIITRLIEVTNEDVELVVVTRWHADEIVAQVSDLEVWPLLRDRANSRLLLQQRLHAKYYRGDRACLIGSANLTSTALSGQEEANLELLIPIDAADPELRGFEDTLLSAVLAVDDRIYENFRDLVADLEPMAQPPAGCDERKFSHTARWYPRSRNPADLYRIYSGSTDYSEGVLHAARTDLLALAPPPGLTKEGFQAAIAISLRDAYLVRALDGFLYLGERRFGEVRDWIGGRLDEVGSKDDRDMVAQALIRWLLTFLPERYQYRRPGHSELLSLRGR